MQDIQLSDGIRSATRDEWQALGDITAEAFQNDPVSTWAFGNIEALRLVFRTMARHTYLKRGICHIAETGGAAMWLPPGIKESMAFGHQLGLAARLFHTSGAGAIRRTLVLDSTMTRHHPKSRHYYLFTVGVLKKNRGTGLGKRLLAPMLQVADREGVPVYLENSNPANTGFYMSQGFVSQQIFRASPDAPPLEAMIRPAMER